QERRARATHDLAARATSARIHDQAAAQGRTHKRAQAQARDAETPNRLSPGRLHVFGGAIGVDDAEQVQSARPQLEGHAERQSEDRKSTRLNSSHLVISYAVF